MQSRLLLLGTLLGCTPSALFAGGPTLKSTASSVHLVAIVPETVSVEPALRSVQLLLRPDRLARAEQPIAITTRWNVARNRSDFVVHALYEDPSGTTLALDSAADAATDSSPIAAKTYQATPPLLPQFLANGRAMELFRQRLTPGVNDRSGRTDAMNVVVDPRSGDRPTTFNYRGVLTLVVQAY